MEFKSIKEMELEIEKLKRDKQKMESETMKEIIDRQIAEISKTLDLIKEAEFTKKVVPKFLVEDVSIDSEICYGGNIDHAMTIKFLVEKEQSRLAASGTLFIKAPWPLDVTGGKQSAFEHANKILKNILQGE